MNSKENIHIISIRIKLIFFFTGDRDRFSLPEEISILHAEFTYYYYPGDIPFPRKYKFNLF